MKCFFPFFLKNIFFLYSTAKFINLVWRQIYRRLTQVLLEKWFWFLKNESGEQKQTPKILVQIHFYKQWTLICNWNSSTEINSLWFVGSISSHVCLVQQRTGKTCEILILALFFISPLLNVSILYLFPGHCCENLCSRYF